MTTTTIITIIIGLLLVWAIGYIGQDTSLGLWGSIGLAIVTTPLIALLIIQFFFKRRAKLSKIYTVPGKKDDQRVSINDH